MARYKAYPEYKDSGVEWLGEIPEHWAFHKFKRIFKIKKHIAGSLGNDVLSVTQRGIKIKNIKSGEGQLSQDYSKYQKVNVGDFAMNHMDLLTGYVDISKFIGVTSPDYRVFGIRDTEAFNARFCLYILQLGYQLKLFFHLGQGSAHLGRWRLPTEAFNEILCPMPSISVQMNIVSFLDLETSRIDALIEKQQTLIELLKEKRQAVISHAVTKGLDPNVPMKDSGVEWLGEVPEHWDVNRVKNVVSGIVDGPHFSPKYVDDGYIFISARNIKVDRWSLDDAKFVSEKDFNEFNKRVKPECGDVLLTKGGTTGIARAVDLEFPFQVWVHVAVLKTIQTQMDPFYFAYVLNGTSCYEQSQQYTQGATNNDLGLSRIAKIFFAKPILEEQREIRTALDKQCNKIDTLISKAKNSVSLMIERRTALISAAVTGKIDVRDWQPEEPSAKTN